MEKQSTRKLFMLVIAVVSMFLLCMSAFMLTSCGETQEEHTHDYTYNVTETAATCGSTGLKVSQCECGQFHVEAVGVTNKHSFKEGYCTVCGLSEKADNKEVLDAIKAANTSASSIAEAVQTALNQQLTNADDSADIKTLSDSVATLTGKLNELQAKADTLATKADTATKAELEAVKAEITKVNAEIVKVNTALTNAQNALIGKINEVKDAIHTHNYTKTENVIAATCRTPGFTVYKCSCGSVSLGDYTAAVGDGEHSYDKFQVTKEADCIHTGIKVWYCTYCAATYQEEIPIAGHKKVVDETNSVGLAKDTDGEVIYNEDEPKIDNCANGAVIKWVCEICEKELETQEVAKAEHVWGEYTESKPASCKEGGEGEKVASCTVCAQKDVQVIPATEAHDFGDWEVKTPAKCEGQTKGEEVRTCRVCGTKESQEIPAPDHTPSGRTHIYYTDVKISETGTVITDRVDVAPGFIGKTAYVGTAAETTFSICSVCGEDFGGQPNPAGIHLFMLDKDVTDERANEEDGTPIIREATADDDQSKVKYGYINVSCTKVGYVWFYCIDETCYVDGHKNVTPNVELAPRGHVFEVDSEVKADCTTAGEKVLKCKYCDEPKTETTEALGHDPVEEITTAATCTTDGLKTVTCSRCDYKDTEVIPALGHDWDDGVVTTPATCKAEGVKTYTCSVCDETKTEKIPVNADGHDYKVPLDEEGNPIDDNLYGFEVGKLYPNTDKEELCWTTAGCDRSGVLVKYCHICDHFEITDTYVPMLGHDYSIVETMEGDCVSGVYVTFSCSRCGVTYSNTIQPADGHKLLYVAAVEETCTTAGHEAFAYCTVCHKVLVDAGMTKENVEAEKSKYSRWNSYKVDAEGKALMYYGDSEVDAEKAASDATLAALGTPALGHDFTVEYPLTTQNCESSGWKMYICSRCGGTVEAPTLKADDPSTYVPADTEVYGKLTVVEDHVLTDAEKTDLTTKINDLLGLTGANALTYEAIADIDTGYNFTKIEFVNALGHDSETTKPCVAVATGYAEYAAYASELNSKLTPEQLDACYKAAFPEDTAMTAGKVAAVCSRCGAIKVATGHNVQYYAYKLTLKDGTVLDWSKVEEILAANYNAETKAYNETEVRKALAANDLWKQAGENKWVKVGSQKQASDGDLATKPVATTAEGEATPQYYVFTLDQIKALGFYNTEAEAVNCYFKAFCANECGLDMGWNKQHTYPVEGNNEKYPNCYDFGYCVWCDTQLLAIGGNHKFTPVDKLTATEKATLEELDWYKEEIAKAKEADCTNVGNEVTIEVCFSCLDALAQGKNITWDNTNYRVTEKEIPAKGHTWEVGGTYPEDPDCLVGFYYYDVCEVCDVKRIETEESKLTVKKEVMQAAGKDSAYYVTDVNGYYGFSGVKSHYVAPVENYFNTDNYIPATADKTAYMSYICLQCGTPVQGYYDDAQYTENNLLYYTMASDEDIAKYQAEGSKFGKVQIARPEDKGVVVAYDAATTFGGLADIAEPYIYINATEDVTLPTSLTLNAATKNVAIGLNGNKLIKNETAPFFVVDYTLSIVNGEITSTVGKDDAYGLFWMSKETSCLYLDGVTAKLNTGIAMSGDSTIAGVKHPAVGSITIVNSNIDCGEGYYGIATNASSSGESKMNVTIENSTIIAAETAVCINVPGTVVIKDSKLQGSWQGIFLRGGKINATIENTVICLTTAVNTSYDYQTNGWKSGNQVPCYAITVGNYGTAPESDAYKTGYLDGETTVALNGVTVYTEKTLEDLKTPAPAPAPAPAAEGSETPATPAAPAATCFVAAKPGLTVNVSVDGCTNVVFETAIYGDETAEIKGVVTVTYTESTPVVPNYPAPAAPTTPETPSTEEVAG